MKTNNLLLTLSVMLLLILSGNRVHGKKWTITVKNYSFVPYNLTHVRARDTIQWVWESGSHTTTSLSIPGGAMDWDFPIDQDNTKFIYIPTEDGTYFYQSTPDTAKGMQGHFVVSGSNGINDPDNSGFEIYPNPSSGMVTLILPSGYCYNASLEIFSLQGVKIRNVDLSSEFARDSATFDMSALPRGIYLFKISAIGQVPICRRVLRD